ncbi:hypothetical protein MAM1_0251c08741 [Mucor ambiguus]|uniref:Uncharacterized protein n=1 Tax=Mucor ambiguus TaxID=91626 RepID=A0A0C9N3R0_9FUNG|nr:hypothetical protein MAM1_0251c08741 [Mucor ambiguus]
MFETLNYHQVSDNNQVEAAYLPPASDKLVLSFNDRHIIHTTQYKPKGPNDHNISSNEHLINTKAVSEWQQQQQIESAHKDTTPSRHKVSYSSSSEHLNTKTVNKRQQQQQQTILLPTYQERASPRKQVSDSSIRQRQDTKAKQRQKSTIDAAAPNSAPKDRKQSLN